MPNPIQTGLIYGVVLGGAIVILILAMMWWNAEILLREYPPDIRHAHGPMSRRARRQHIIASAVFLVVCAGILVASYRQPYRSDCCGLAHWYSFATTDDDPAGDRRASGI